MASRGRATEHTQPMVARTQFKQLSKMIARQEMTLRTTHKTRTLHKTYSLNASTNKQLAIHATHLHFIYMYTYCFSCTSK